MNDEPRESGSVLEGESREARELRDLQNHVSGLRGALHVAALCGIVLSVSFFLFVHKQVEGLQRQASELSAYVNDYQKNFVPQLEAARSNLVSFARQNPSAAPVLSKYFTNAAPAKTGSVAQ